jgi:hypothetical protein
MAIRPDELVKRDAQFAAGGTFADLPFLAVVGGSRDLLAGAELH